MKRNLVLMTSVALIVLMAVSILAINWPWNIAGNATDTNPWSKTKYYVYDGKIKPINIGGVNYLFNSTIRSRDNAIVSIEGESISLTKKGDVKSFENYPVEIRVKKISYNSKNPARSYVGFNVRKFTQQGKVAGRPTLTEYVDFYPAQKIANTKSSIYSGVSIHTIQDARYGKYETAVFFFGPSWDCVELHELDTESKIFSGRATTKSVWSYTSMPNAGAPMCMIYGDASIGDVCVLMKNHPCTGKDEWVAVYNRDMQNDPHLLNPTYDDITEVPYYLHNPSTGSVERSGGNIPSYYEYDRNRKTITPYYDPNFKWDNKN